MEAVATMTGAGTVAEAAAAEVAEEAIMTTVAVAGTSSFFVQHWAKQSVHMHTCILFVCCGFPRQQGFNMTQLGMALLTLCGQN